MYKKIEIPKEVLQKLYVIEGKSSLEIGRMFNTGKSVILRRLREYGIERRSSHEHMKGRFGEKNFMFGKHHSEETKAKIREKQSGQNNIRYGIKHTEESRQKMSDNLRKHQYGDRIIRDGYYLIYIPYSSSQRGKWVYEHRLVVEQALGRKLKSEEIVHHKDGNKLNNDIANLELLSSIAEHNRRHKNLPNMK